MSYPAYNQKRYIDPISDKQRSDKLKNCFFVNFSIVIGSIYLKICAEVIQETIFGGFTFLGIFTNNNKKMCCSDHHPTPFFGSYSLKETYTTVIQLFFFNQISRGV